jgi:alpha-mannosidase
LYAQGIEANLVDDSQGHAVNDYLYLIGDDPDDAQQSGPVAIAVRDRGPLVSSLMVTSEAPGCWQLQREVRLIAGGDHVELINTVDKRRLQAKDYFANDGKESVNFAFPLQVPGGSVRLDVPLGVMRPDADQIASACKNWFTVGRWADVSNGDFGVTWVTLDAPLVQLGGLTATLLNSQSDPAVWRKQVGPTQRLYSWAMNNHWGTNYRAFQEGPVIFRYALRPHDGAHDDAESSRFAAGLSQPLIALAGRGEAPSATPLLTLEPASVIVTGLKPSDDGRSLIVRLLNVSDSPAAAEIAWPQQVVGVYSSSTAEREGEVLQGKIEVPARGLVTLRAEYGDQK